MTYTFLLLNLFLFLIPFVLILDKKVFFVKNISSTLIPSLIVTVIFSCFLVFLTGLKVWVFNPAYLIGISFMEVPIEEYLFMFTFSFAGLGLYNYLNIKFPKNDLQKYSLTVSQIIMGVCFAFFFFAYAKWYTAITFISLMLLLVGIEYVNTLRFMYKFYRAFAVMLIPFYSCFAIICNLPIKQYHNYGNVGFNLAKIPFENHFFMMAAMLLGVHLMEIFKHRKKNG